MPLLCVGVGGYSTYRALGLLLGNSERSQHISFPSSFILQTFIGHENGHIYLQCFIQYRQCSKVGFKSPVKNWCFWIVVLKKTLETPLDCKEIKPVNPKGNKPRLFIGRTVAEAKSSILWPLDSKSQLTGRDPDAGKDWRQEEKRVTEDGIVGWHHWLNGQEFEQTLGSRKGQQCLTCFSPRGCKESNMT